MVHVNLRAIETIYFFWESMKQKEKVTDSYIQTIASMPEMKPLYHDEFSQDSVRKVLSAISNREVLNNANKLERKFWNLNMLVLEEMDKFTNIFKQLKSTSFQSLRTDPEREINFAFIPGLADLIERNDEYIAINFFKLILVEGDIVIDSKKLLNFMQEAIDSNNE